MRTAAPLVALLALALLGPAPAEAYPLDGYPETGIRRLEAYRLSALGRRRPDFLTEGEMLPERAVRLALREHPGLRIPAPDPDLQGRLRGLLGADAADYGVAVLDYTDPARPRYAGHQADRPQNPGSVGKIMVLLAWFQALRDIVGPEEVARRKLLYDTWIEADGFIRTDSHDVPIWDFGAGSVEKRPIQEGDRASLWTFFDWMASASSNAAASMLMKHLVLLRHFEGEYPVDASRADAYLRNTPRAELTRVFLDAIQSPVKRSGLDLGRLRQGSFFTREAKQRIPGTNSVSTAGELLRYVVRMEQGRLVDPFSSLEIKKLLYLTDRRIRYASHPILDDAAVYFKSGSLYSCRPEPGYQCAKFLGNRLNYMNSVVVIEELERDPPLRYAVVVLSNVLRKNSSDVHEELGAEIHRIIRSYHPDRRRGASGYSEGAPPAGPAPR